ncbi:MAG: IS66-like element ISH10 family transposase [Chloroflexota bacterium]
MDEHLPLGSLDASTLRMLLTQERAARQNLEQEVARLRAGIARQNERIIALERENTELRQMVQDLQGMVAGLTEQNLLLRQQVAALQTENNRLRGGRPAKASPGAWPSETTQQPREPKQRKTRDPKHNRGRHRMLQVDEQVRHDVAVCPRCGSPLAGGWVHRRVQVIDLPAPVEVQVTEHLVMARHCPCCRQRVLPSAPALAAGRLGRCRFGPRLIAAIATMAIVERLPGRQIQARLQREYGLSLSHGGIIGLLRMVAQRGQPAYQQLAADVRASPVVHADETGWREDGLPGFIWTLSTPTTCLFHRDPHRSGAVIDGLLGDAFGGTLVTDFYAVYDHLPGVKQRCWAHLWRDIDALEHEYPEDKVLAAWVAGVRAIYDLAIAPRPATEEGATPGAMRARERRARRYEQQILAMCPETLAPDRPEATLVKRIRRYRQELFTFVRDPAVPHTNNAAERSLRPLVIARKVSGGTRSQEGSTTRMVLASLAATARLRGDDPSATFFRLVQAPSHPS